MDLHALGAAHTVDGGAIAQTRGARLGSFGPVAGPRRPFPFCLSKARLLLHSCCQYELFLRAFFPCTSFLFPSARLIYIVVPSL